MKLDSAGHVLSETAWIDSGGGVSAHEARPDYQNGVQSSSFRGVPDVSYVADPATGMAVYSTTRYSGRRGWFEVGGTSAGSPQVAALMALANQGRSTLSATPIAGFYAAAAARVGAFDDIVSGCNSTTSSALTCASTGYDYMTGLGSTLANALVPYLHGI